ncbi:tRNA-His guanylyltransferase [Gnomoniopsis smithogilvyi]|uniref:tRNA(His) guanylyltransferase n=1 Tax=Gnomoniopsis smithogilvyi TaxID=1191159 RepID=A0A9W9D1R8_9PEZI|nr:tRNA-His guanylyltransferase [Gnomoniopsis smithogilvyi]
MANSKYEYVKDFERSDKLSPDQWIVVRIDGRGFTKFANKYAFEKPNDRKALDLMNEAAKFIMTEIPELVIAYGVSDEYSFVFHETCKLFERRESKLVTTIVSTFSSYYIYLWPKYFPDKPLSPPLPSFDGRAVLYPKTKHLRNYMSWRQADCHINNLYNTTFWSLIQQGGMTNQEAEKALAGTLSADKNEILFSRFGINYNNEPAIYKKGSVIFRDFELVEPDTHNTFQEVDDVAEPLEQSKTQAEKEKKKRLKARVVVEHLDIIQDEFWNKRPWILSNKPGKIPKASST